MVFHARRTLYAPVRGSDVRMVKISWDSFSFPRVGGNSRLGRTAETTWAKSRVAEKNRDTQDNKLLLRTKDPLAQTLENRLRKFQTALNGFEWPRDDSIMRKARLVVPDKDLKGYVSGTVPEYYGPERAWTPVPEEGLTGEDKVERYYKYFSRGFQSAAKTTLEPGEYQFHVTQGGTVKTLSVDVGAGMTNKEVLEATADAINDSPLSVRAHVIEQTGPGTQIKGLQRTGAVLALSVNAADVDQDVSLRDRTGHGYLVKGLALLETKKPVGPAEVAAYALNGPMLARPGTFTTDSFDPEATTTLGRGTYDFTLAVGNTSRDMTVSVAEGDTWKQVLTSMAHAVNSTGLAEAEVKKVERPSEVLTDLSKNILTEGAALEITAVDPKAGQRLSITGGDNQASGTFTVASTTDNTASVSMEQYLGAENGTPVTVSATSSLPAPLDPLSTYYLYRSGTGIPAAPNGYQGEYYFQFASTAADAEAGTNIIDLADSGSGTLSMDGGNVLTALGVGSPSPGTDGEMRVNGRTLDRMPGAFSVDRGRAVVNQQKEFGETLPLRVVEAVEQLDTALSDVVSAYNDLRTFILSNENLLDQGFADRFRAPLEEDRAGLEWLGMKEWGAKRLLTLAADEFYSALGQDPEKARELLNKAETGLIPAWKNIVGSILGNDVADYLRNSETIVEEFLGNETRTEVELDKRNKLLDLLG